MRGTDAVDAQNSRPVLPVQSDDLSRQEQREKKGRPVKKPGGLASLLQSRSIYSLAAFGQPAQPPPASALGQAGGFWP
jgi:hypothetical protein